MNDQLIQVRFPSSSRRYTYNVPSEWPPVAVGDEVEVLPARRRTSMTVEVVAVNVARPAGIDITDIEAVVSRHTPVPTPAPVVTRLLPIVIIPNDTAVPVIIVMSGIQDEAEQIAIRHGLGRNYVLASAVVEKA